MGKWIEKLLSPTHFSIFINDIVEINKFPNDRIQSLLFADDLFSFMINNGIFCIKNQVHL